MNTKSILGIIIVAIIIILIVVWLRKTPESTVVAPVTETAPAVPTPTATSTTAPTSAPAPVSTATTTQSKIISTTMKDNMKIEVTKEGTGPAITNGQTAVMLYTGKLDNGTVFDSTANHGNQPFSFTLGAGQVIKGWDEGIVGMKVGEARTLIIPAALAYGAAGYPPVIPANATLTFDVTLVGIK
jgi:FKBP-type peptidyl-prolyl cis-trans isomerase